MSAGAAPLPPEEFFRLLRSASASLTATSAAALSQYLGLLDLWRRRTNLTGKLEPEALVAHALESAFGQSLIPPGLAVADIGSGGGFPGVPLAIVRPDLRVSAVEPRRKRADFLRLCAAKLPVPNLGVLEKRASALEADRFQAATSRAVGGIREALGGAPFLEPGGVFLAWTTEPEALARDLMADFELERILAVPDTRRKAIAAFRKRQR